MREQIRDAFGAVHADEALKERTRAFLAERAYGRRRPRPAVRRLALAAACLVLLVTLGGWRAYFTPTASVSIEVNPWVELSVNRFDRVIGVTGRNDDGAALAEDLGLRFLTCDQAIQAVLTDSRVAALLAEDAVMTIAVTGEDEGQCGRLLSGAERCTAGEDNAYCYCASGQEAREASEAGLSCGKYRAYLALRELDPSVTAEEVRDMTLSQLRDRIAALTAAVQDSPAQGNQNNQNNQNGQSGQSGQGGQGAGSVLWEDSGRHCGDEGHCGRGGR